jgi:hypothetical protein
MRITKAAESFNTNPDELHYWMSFDSGEKGNVSRLTCCVDGRNI